MNIADKVWFITGCSTGLGRALALSLLKSGYRVAVTARKLEQITDITEKYPEHAIALAVDVTQKDTIRSAVDKTLKRFGRIDVLVNNAGIGYFSAIEESEEDEYRKLFEINFFGLHEVTKAVLPIMRRQKSGHIINIASIAGIVGFPAVGFYNASKFAVHGYSESLAKEVAHLGIRVTIISPSGFRSDWAGRSAKESSRIIDDYEASAGANKTNLRNYHGKQPGDPELIAAALIKITTVEKPPLHLLIGAAALKNAKIKLDLLNEDIRNWESTTRSTDHFPENTGQR